MDINFEKHFLEPMVGKIWESFERKMTEMQEKQFQKLASLIDSKVDSFDKKTDEPRHFSKKDISKHLRCTEKTLDTSYRLRSDFPKPINIGNKPLLWRVSDISTYLNKDKR